MLVACWQSVCGLQSCLQQEGGNSATSIFRTNCQPQQLLFAVGCSGLISSVCQHTQAEEQSVLVHSDQQFGVGLLPFLQQLTGGGWWQSDEVCGLGCGHGDQMSQGCGVLLNAWCVVYPQSYNSWGGLCGCVVVRFWWAVNGGRSLLESGDLCQFLKSGSDQAALQGGCTRVGLCQQHHAF